MPKPVAIRAVAAALGCCIAMLIFRQAAVAAATTPSRTPVCMTVTDSYIINFLHVKVPTWLFTNHCNYNESFYAEYPGTTVWIASGEFSPYQSISIASNGKSASLIHILECPKGWGALGSNPKVCYK